jgi:hypothetical protein
MTIESTPTFRVAPTAAPTAPAAAPQGAADQILAPIDHLHDRLAGGLASIGQTAESSLARTSPVLGAMAQFLVGAAGAVGTMAEGTWQTVRHPIRTIQGLWALATHVPLTPMWLWRMVADGPRRTLGEDKAFFGAVLQGILSPYKADWQAGRYFAVAGRAAVDIGTLYVGLKQAKTAVDRWRAERALRTPEESLVSQVMGNETRATGQVLGEGTAVVDAKAGATAVDHPWVHRPEVSGADMLAAVKKRHHQPAPVLDSTVPTREALERAASRFPGEKGGIRQLAIEKLERDQELFRRIRQVGPERLATDRAVQVRMRLLSRSVDARMDQEIAQLLGVQPQGLPKEPLRAAAKLEQLQAASGPKVRLGNVEDLARGRIDLPNFSPSRMRAMLKSIRRHFGDDNLIVRDYIQGKPFYRGRLHVKIRDASGMWYELQMGPKQLSHFYDTPFTAAGRSVNVHDAVYKGLLKLDDAALKVLGKGNPAKGSARVERVLDLYVDEVTDVMNVAKRGEPYAFHPQTSALRRGLVDLLDEIPEDLLPIGLR